jgi:hypothetical protein
MRWSGCVALAATYVAIAASPAAGWSGPVPLGDPTVGSGNTPSIVTATAFADPSGGMHVVVGNEDTPLRWRTFDATGHLGAAQPFPGPTASPTYGAFELGPMAWLPDGRALVTWLTSNQQGSYAAIRNTDGTWGPVTNNFPVAAAIAARDNEALVWSPNTVRQFLIGTDGTLTQGSSVSLVQQGDSSGGCGGAMAIDSSGNATLAYSAGTQIRQAVRTPDGAWTVTAGQDAPGTGCPTGSGQHGRLVIVWPVYGSPQAPDGTYPSVSVKAATATAGSPVVVHQLKSDAVGAGETALRATYTAAAGPDGSVAAWAGTAKCVNGKPVGGAGIATAPPTGDLGGLATLQTADATHLPGGAWVSAFAGSSLAAADLGVRPDTSSSSCTLPGEASEVHHQALEPGASAADLSSYGPQGQPISLRGAAIDGREDGVVVGVQQGGTVSTGLTYQPLMWINGTPGAGAAGGSTTTPPPGGGTGTAPVPPGGGSPAPAPVPAPAPAPRSQSVRFLGVTPTADGLDVSFRVPATAGANPSTYVAMLLTVAFNRGAHRATSAAATKAKAVVVGKAKKTLHRAGKFTVLVRYTKAGLALLKRHHRITATLKLTTKTRGRSAVVSKRHLTLRFRKKRAPQTHH